MTVLDSRLGKSFGTAIILAGGKSSRMGFDKQFLEVDDRRIIDSLILKLEEEFDEIIIVTNKVEEYKDYKHKIVKDIIVGKGPLSGIHVGLKEASSHYAFVIACDMPIVNIDYIKYMKTKMVNKDLDGCVSLLGGQIEPFHGFYGKRIIGQIEKQLGNKIRSVNRLIKRLNFLQISEEKARSFSPNWSMFLNLNTEEDLNKYKLDQ